jgi:hypothetical protein
LLVPAFAPEPAFGLDEAFFFGFFETAFAGSAAGAELLGAVAVAGFSSAACSGELSAATVTKPTPASSSAAAANAWS